jgi:hypothetical protein
MITTVRPGSFQVARESGVAGALAAAYRALGATTLHIGPRGHVLAPPAVLDAASRTCPAEPRGPSGELRLELPPDLDRLGVAARRYPSQASGTACCTAFLIELTWLRSGLSHALLDTATGFARTRSVGGRPLLHQQLVKGTLADVLIDLAAIDADLSDAPPDEARLTDLHAAITRVDRTLLRLLGAGGFTSAGPAGVAYLSELLADAYAPRPVRE